MSEEAVEAQPSEAEKEAIDNGWNPDREAVEAEGKKWVSAEEFNERGSLFKKINEQKKKIESLESNFENLNRHYQKVAETERKKAKREYEQRIADLEAEKLRALDESDHNRVIEIDREIRATEQPKVETNDEWSQDVVDRFKAENKWYSENDEMREFADEVGVGYNARYPDASPQKVFEHIKKRVEKAFPEAFANPNRDKPSAVEGDKPPAPKSGKLSVRDLTPDEKEVFNNFKRMKGFFKTEDDIQKYLKQVIEVR